MTTRICDTDGRRILKTVSVRPNDGQSAPIVNDHRSSVYVGKRGQHEFVSPRTVSSHFATVVFLFLVRHEMSKVILPFLFNVRYSSVSNLHMIQIGKRERTKQTVPVSRDGNDPVRGSITSRSAILCLDSSRWRGTTSPSTSSWFRSRMPKRARRPVHSATRSTPTPPHCQNACCDCCREKNQNR